MPIGVANSGAVFDGAGAWDGIFDLYDLAMDEHRKALRAWRIRNEA
jgi:hypothetical protein